MTLKAANGLNIPYVGYFVTEVKVLGQKLTNKGFLVIREPVGGNTPPCLLGMNILQHVKAFSNLSTPEPE